MYHLTLNSTERFSVQVIQETSAVTFMVAGTFKEVVTVMFSVIIFGDEFHFINGMGLLVLLCGEWQSGCRMQH